MFHLSSLCLSPGEGTNATPVSAPPLEGPEMEPVIGEKLELPAGLPLSVEAALQRYGTSTMKAPAATVLDGQGKVGTTLLYGACFQFFYVLIL